MSLLLIVSCLVTSIMTSSVFGSVHAEAAAKKYLVLVQDKQGEWVGYQDLAYKSKSGGIMVPAKAISKKLGLTYTNAGKGKFTLAKGSTKKCDYTRGAKTYVYTKSGVKANKTVKYAPELSADKANSVYSLGMTSMVYSQYYTATSAAKYKAAGYGGVVCYSLKGKITKLPAVKEVKNAEKLGLSGNSNGFEAHGLTVNVKEGTEYKYVTSCNLGQATGTIKFHDSKTFASDKNHPAKKGYEWKKVIVDMAFEGPAVDMGIRYREAWEDYYDIPSHDKSMKYIDDTSASYSVIWNGKTYTDCFVEEIIIDSQAWTEPDEEYFAMWGTEYPYSTMSLEYYFCVPKGYDGTIIAFYDSAIVWEEGQYIYDVADENTLFFRLK